MTEVTSSVQNGIADEDELLQKHKKERKELQSKIQSLKKTATKGDKKKKKEVQEEIAKLESDLDRKHREELSAFQTKEVKGDCVNDVQESLKDMTISSSDSAHKVSKAQKRREKKAAEQREREKRITEQEIENETGQRNVENEKIKEVLKEKLLMIHDIPSDGNCLYNAVDHQLKQMLNYSLGVEKLRKETSNQLRVNKADYLPFISDPNSGDLLTDEQFQEYCDNVANTTNWGGQVELRALTHVLKLPIEVIQADGPPIVMGEEYDANSLTLTYHRHMYKLGEHYNSVVPLVEESDFT